MIRRKIFNIGKAVLVVLMCSLFSLNTSQASLGDFLANPENPGSVVQKDDLNIGPEVELETNEEGQPASPESNSEGEFTSPLDDKGDEIVSETCEIAGPPDGQQTMRCSRSKRFEKVAGEWKDFNEIMNEEYL
ncbi:MAG: hypothetical protein PHH01_04475, partial [Patescibacteria group bacterium]|nr:hypothetical protein [Patescibacteria group bacterium]